METEARTLRFPMQLQGFKKCFSMTIGCLWTALGLEGPGLSSKTSAGRNLVPPADPISPGSARQRTPPWRRDERGIADECLDGVWRRIVSPATVRATASGGHLPTGDRPEQGRRNPSKRPTATRNHREATQGIPSENPDFLVTVLSIWASICKVWLQFSAICGFGGCSTLGSIARLFGCPESDAWGRRRSPKCWRARTTSTATCLLSGECFETRSCFLTLRVRGPR